MIFAQLSRAVRERIGGFAAVPVVTAAATMAVFGPLSITAQAQQEGIHPVELSIQVSDAQNWDDTFNPLGSVVSGGVFNFMEQAYSNPANEDWDMDWDFNAAPVFDPAAVINGNFVVRNTSAETLEFRIRVTMPLLSPVGPGRFFGSAGLTVGGNPVAELGTLPGAPGWDAAIDGLGALGAEMFLDPYVLTNGDDASATVGLHDGGLTSIGLNISFDLSPGAAMTVTSAFTAGSTIDKNWNTVDSGGGVSTGGTYTMWGTIGQPDPTPMSGGDFTAAGGFWGLFGVPAPPPVNTSCPADLDGDTDVGFGDILAILSAWGPCAGCPEDMDYDGLVGFTEILAILGAWGPCE